MKIHIIRHAPESTTILSRKAQVLARALGWSMSSKPNPAADIQYAFPYLDYRGPEATLPQAAYYTHREDTIPGKVKIWRAQAETAILRITSAQQYYDDLSPHGATARILPPLDREKFQPIEKRSDGKKEVGLSGYIYPGGRKGEKILTRDILNKYNWKASGKGWPVVTKEYPYDRLQEFFQRLEVYVCTATIEGIPYPPLEALACGTKIVIPRGVGLLDELPDIPGIHRYQAGDAQDLDRAIQEAMDTTASQEELRAATEPFNDDQWIEGHAAAFAELEDLTRKTAKVSTKTADKGKRKDRGIYTVAYGENARECAKRLIASVNRIMPDLPIMVCGDQPVKGADHNVTLPGMDPGARKGKFAAYQTAPETWKEVVFLDADTELMEPIDFLFDAIRDGWQMVFTKDVSSRHTAKFLKRSKNRDDYMKTIALTGTEQALVLAGGVWGFGRNTKAREFLNQWAEEFGEINYRDQGPMLRAFYKTRPRALIVGNEWNSFFKLRYENRAEIIRHHSYGQAREHTGGLKGTPRPYRIENMSKNPVERGGMVFLPGQPRDMEPTKAQIKEVKACKVLQVR